MKRHTLFCVLLFVLFCMGLTFRGSAQSKTPKAPKAWTYDPEFQPVTQSEITRMARNPNMTVAGHTTLIARASNSHLSEFAVTVYNDIRKARPNNPVLQSAYCYALFSSQEHGGPSSPAFKTLFAKQKETILLTIELADKTARGPGAKIPFCWRASAFLNMQGAYAGFNAGIAKLKRAYALDPNDPYTLRLLAYSYTRGPLQSRDYDKGISYASRIIKLMPNSASGYGYMSTAYAEKKDYISAFPFVEKAQNRVPPEFRVEGSYLTYKNLAIMQRNAEAKAKAK